jgi:microcin C transport system permease protein
MFSMNPVNQRRLRAFRSNRRAVVSLWVLVIAFVLSLVAELIANDKPVFIVHESEFYLPAFFTYSETDFGGDFESEADYRDEFFLELLGEQALVVWPPIRFSYDTVNTALDVPAPSPPSSVNWLGTDDQARDVAARAIYGFRISLLFGLALTLASSVIGIVAGAVQGYFGGWLDLVLQRILEIWSSLPQLYLLIILASVIEPNFWWLLLIMLLFSWMALVGVVRAEFLRVRNFEYVHAARALGVRTRVIMFRHVLPNAMVASVTFMPFILNSSIVTLTSLDFLGFGLPPGSPSLGELIAQGKANLHAPWLGITAFVVLGTLLTLLTFVFEGVRDAFDPRKTLTDAIA